MHIPDPLPSGWSRPLGLIVSGILVFAGWAGAQTPPSPPVDLVIKNATVMTASHGTIDRGAVWVHAGKIAAVGAAVNAPAGAAVVDASGMWLTPGIMRSAFAFRSRQRHQRGHQPGNAVHAHD